MDREKLKEDDLHAEVQRLLLNLDSAAGVDAAYGPEGEVDLAVTFPKPIVREAPGHGLVPFRIGGQLLIEVKSRHNKPANLDMCRQLLDWVVLDYERRFPKSAREAAVMRFQRSLGIVARELKERLAEPDGVSEVRRWLDSPLSFRSSLKPIADAGRDLVRAHTRPSKGLLVLNHEFANDPRGEPFNGDIERWAATNDLALISWLELLAIERDIQTGALDAFDFFCHLLDTNGVIRRPISYRWHEHRDMYMAMLFSREWPDHMFPSVRPSFLLEPTST